MKFRLGDLLINKNNFFQIKEIKKTESDEFLYMCERIEHWVISGLEATTHSDITSRYSIINPIVLREYQIFELFDSIRRNKFYVPSLLTINLVQWDVAARREFFIEKEKYNKLTLNKGKESCIM